ncbi:WD40 repeat-like protein [Sporormia fimetaria CBS 119925]|uniref:WD40 repeat-like protein n=1 Tax=Sporormia fimetaria CBS 119925 TaxID=1340428 RepID=A0A6A6VBJ0_9PLEO|nr:WD40 repeat-like protein [Sporormia fimetaria CBS 119925]
MNRTRTSNDDTNDDHAEAEAARSSPSWARAADDDDIDVNDSTTNYDEDHDDEDEEDDDDYEEHDGNDPFDHDGNNPLIEAMQLAEGLAPQTAGSGERRHLTLTRDQILNLFNQPGLAALLGMTYGGRGAFARRDDYSSDDDTLSGGSKRSKVRGPAAFEKVPSEEGQKLMDSGLFGTTDRREDSIRRKKKLQYRIMHRELGLGSHGRQRNENGLIKQNLIPETAVEQIIHYNSRCYSGQFSDDGDFFFSCGQDFRVRMYDTSNPYNWKYYKSVEYPYGQWTITDASLSRDNRFLAYSSIRNIVCLASTDPDDDSGPTLLNFSDGPGHHFLNHYFGIWSVRFSGDGKELVAGTGDDSVYVYDIERRQTTLRIPGHDNDVNAVCFGDALSPHILYSGSDDTTLKVWDRRSMGDGREAGVFLGHTEGLTFVDSKGDGRYVISNAKDQTAKLWDLRKMMSAEKAERIDISRYTTEFEYRRNKYPVQLYRPHPHDCSLVTFRGHSVLQTLIRCHFSPPGSSDSRYVYSGSYDGKVYVWNMDATLAGTIDVQKATENTRPTEPRESFYEGDAYATCVRDASWHPYVPMLAATSWNSYGATQGTCTVHSWNDGLKEDEAEPRMGRRVNAVLAHDDRLYRGFHRHQPYDDDEDDEEDDDEDEYEYILEEEEETEEGEESEDNLAVR